MRIQHEILKELVRHCANRALESKYYQRKYREARKALKAYEKEHQGQDAPK